MKLIIDIDTDRSKEVIEAYVRYNLKMLKIIDIEIKEAKE